MVDIVLHAILFQPFEYQGLYILYTSFRDATKQPRMYDVLRKDYNSDKKDAYLPHSSLAFYQLRLRLLT